MKIIILISTLLFTFWFSQVGYALTPSLKLPSASISVISTQSDSDKEKAAQAKAKAAAQAKAKAAAQAKAKAAAQAKAKAAAQAKAKAAAQAKAKAAAQAKAKVAAQAKAKVAAQAKAKAAAQAKAKAAAQAKAKAASSTLSGKVPSPDESTVGIGVRGPLSNGVGSGSISDSDVALGIRGPIAKKISKKEKTYIDSLGDKGVKTSKINGKVYKEIQSSGCKNSSIRRIGNDRYVCEGNIWLGPLGGDGVFSSRDDTDAVSGVIIGDNHFKELDKQSLEKIKQTVSAKWKEEQDRMSKMSKEELEELLSALPKAELQLLSGGGPEFPPEIDPDLGKKGSDDPNSEALKQAVAMLEDERDERRADILSRYLRDVETAESLYDDRVYRAGAEYRDRGASQASARYAEAVIRIRELARRMSNIASSELASQRLRIHDTYRNNLQIVIDQYSRRMQEAREQRRRESSGDNQRRRDANANYVEAVGEAERRRIRDEQLYQRIRDRDDGRAIVTKEEFISAIQSSREESILLAQRERDTTLRPLMDTRDQRIDVAKSQRDESIRRARAIRDRALARLDN